MEVGERAGTGSEREYRCGKIRIEREIEALGVRKWKRIREREECLKDNWGK